MTCTCLRDRSFAILPPRAQAGRPAKPGHTPCTGMGTVCSGTGVARTIEGGSCCSTTQRKRYNNVYFHDLTQRAPSLYAEKLKGEKATSRAGTALSRRFAAAASTGRYGGEPRGDALPAKCYNFSMFQAADDSLTFGSKSSCSRGNRNQRLKSADRNVVWKLRVP